MLDHYHFHTGFSKKQYNNILNLLKMGQEQLDALNAKIDAQEQKIDTLTTATTNIREDITRIKEGLPTEGGLTQAEVATLSTRLDTLGQKTDTAIAEVQALDRENEPGTGGGNGEGL